MKKPPKKKSVKKIWPMVTPKLRISQRRKQAVHLLCVPASDTTLSATVSALAPHCSLVSARMSSSAFMPLSPTTAARLPPSQPRQSQPGR